VLETSVSALDDLKVNLSVVLGRSRMPVHMLLRMGRGAVIELESTETDMVEILANDHPIARGQIIVTGTRIAIEVTQIIRKPEIVTTSGTTVGDGAIAREAAAAV
jgi:flagellar motor switch protein FliN